jgi:hypothetical protein
MLNISLQGENREAKVVIDEITKLNISTSFLYFTTSHPQRVCQRQGYCVACNIINDLQIEIGPLDRGQEQNRVSGHIGDFDQIAWIADGSGQYDFYLTIKLRSQGLEIYQKDHRGVPKVIRQVWANESKWRIP